MSDVADGHRRIAAVVAPLERMGVDAAVHDQATEDGDLCLTLDLRIPPALDAIDGGRATERAPVPETWRNRLEAERGGASDRVDEVAGRTSELERRIDELESHHDAGTPTGEEGHGPARDDAPTGALADLTDGERETLLALRKLGHASGSGEIAAEVDATLQSVRSWLPDLVRADHVRAEPDPTDGRRKLYSPVVADDGMDGDGMYDGMNDGRAGRSAREPTTDDGHADEKPGDGPREAALDDVGTSERPDETARQATNDDGVAGAQSDGGDGGGQSDGGDGGGQSDGGDGGGQSDDGRVGDDEPENARPEGTVYIASNGGSPSQVFHVRPDCPQLRKSSDFVEKDRSVVPHHRPCSTCVHDDLEAGLVAIAAGSPTTTYHKREDCPKLGSAIEVAVRDHETVADYAPCRDCVDPGIEADRDADGEPSAGSATDDEDAAGQPADGSMVQPADDSVRESSSDSGIEANGDSVGERSGHSAARICAGNDLRREAIVAALDGATAIYHVQRDLGLSRDETEALLAELEVLDDLEGGGCVSPDRASSVVREHVPRVTQLDADGGGPGG